MRVLVACEFSGRVRDAFRRTGHYALSCDFRPTESSGYNHYQGDVKDIINDDWDLMVAHPPCTYLAVSGRAWWSKRQKEQGEALDFVQFLMDANIPRICIENPISLISTKIRKPDQIIHPWMFGDGEKKATCLWLKNLPKLIPDRVVTPVLESFINSASGPNRAHDRSRTYPGIARAMAEQWPTNNQTRKPMIRPSMV